MLLIFMQAEGLELFWFFSGVTLNIMLPATLSGCSGQSLSLPYILYICLFNSGMPDILVVTCNVTISFKSFHIKYKAWFTPWTWMHPCLKCTWLKASGLESTCFRALAHMCEGSLESPANGLLFIGRCLWVKARHSRPGERRSQHVSEILWKAQHIFITLSKSICFPPDSFFFPSCLSFAFK